MGNIEKLKAEKEQEIQAEQEKLDKLKQKIKKQKQTCERALDELQTVQESNKEKNE